MIDEEDHHKNQGQKIKNGVVLVGKLTSLLTHENYMSTKRVAELFFVNGRIRPIDIEYV